MSKKRKANDKALPEAPKAKIKVEPGLESKTSRYSDDQFAYFTSFTPTYSTDPKDM